MASLLAIAAALSVPDRADAQNVGAAREHSGAVTITADRPTAIQGIDDLVFTVTREVAAAHDLRVPLTMSPGIVPSDRLRHTVIIGAHETSAKLTVAAFGRAFGAVTGDVTATVGDGESYDVGDPSAASVRVYLGRGLVTIGFESSSVAVSESVGGTTNEIRLVARTQPNIPPPFDKVQVAVITKEGTARRVEDYRGFSRTFRFNGEPHGNWVSDGDAYVSRVQVPVWLVRDDLDEEDETFGLRLQQLPNQPWTVMFIPADPAAPPCGRSNCKSTVVIVDDDTRGVSVSPAGTLPVNEGDAAAYTVVLDSEPTADVTVTPEVRSATDAEISASAAVTFTPKNWHQPQTVTVTAAADDNAVDGSATIAHTVAGGDYGADGVTAASVPVAEQDREANPGCTPAECDNTITFIDNDIPADDDEPEDSDEPEVIDEPEDDESEDGDEPEVVDEPEPVVVSLVRVPDGTVIPDNSTVSEGGTVLDGSTFQEGERAWFRILLSAADGGPAPGGADVELSFWWHHNSPLVPTSGQISKVVFSLPRVDVWDTVVQIPENTVGNPDSTLTVRITGCERNGCVIGERSEITVTIADDDGGPAAAPPGRPQSPAVLCPDRGHSSSDTGLKVIWEAPQFEGGAPIEYYEVRYRDWTDLDNEDPGWGEWQLWHHGNAATSTTIVGLNTDTAYGVQVRAVNANGPGEWSSGRTHTTSQPDHICDILDELHGG